MILRLLLLASILAGSPTLLSGGAGDPPPSTRIVSPSGPYFTIQEAISGAQEGDRIEVQPGVYQGPLVIEKRVILEGTGWPVIDNGGQGTVVTLAAPGIEFRGFEVRGSGVEPDRDHAGITLTAPRIVVENNRLRDVLFGIFVAQSDDSIVRDNDVTSKTGYEVGRKGDGIRLWYSQRVQVIGNAVHESRDVVIWYSEGVVLVGNRIQNGRYGVHLMYCDRAIMERNQILNNSVGIYIMYSNNVVVHENDIRGQRGPSGYGLGFKDADNIEISGNILADNRAGAYLDGLPFSPQGFGHFRENIFAFNDIGVILLPAVHGGQFEKNTFWENGEGMAIQGGGGEANLWQGNFWSDYTGFDADGDGLGETPYHADRFYESLADREPLLRALYASPAVQAIEFAATTFPLMRPQPKLIDQAPSSSPAVLPDFAARPAGRSIKMILAAALVCLLAALCAALSLSKPRLLRNLLDGPERKFMRPQKDPRPASRLKIGLAPDDPVDASEVGIMIQGLEKSYGKLRVLDGVSLAAGAGEVIALWGANGAGKTTLLKCILGLVRYEGSIYVGGYDVRRYGKEARRLIGYVPQDTAFYDMQVRETLAFYARIKKTNPDVIPYLVEKLGLLEHMRKRVSALSGGLRQRLALAVALLNDPPILLLDEPTANLDARSRQDYLTRLAALRQGGKTILYASHRIEEVESLANRVLVLERGRVEAIVTAADFRERFPANDFLQEQVQPWN